MTPDRRRHRRRNSRSRSHNPLCESPSNAGPRRLDATRDGVFFEPMAPSAVREALAVALEYTPDQEFLAKVYGTPGDFNSPAGPVGFLLTKARLGAVGADSERRFTEHIVPFREVIPARELTF